MKHRGVASVVILTIVTFGIYGIVWHVKTKNEMNKLGAEIPTAWLIIVPIANIYWLWRYSEGVEKVTNGKISAILSFVMLWLLSVIGMAIVQSEFNKLSASPVAAGTSPAPPSPDAQPHVAEPSSSPSPSPVQTVPEASTSLGLDTPQVVEPSGLPSQPITSPGPAPNPTPPIGPTLNPGENPIPPSRPSPPTPPLIQ